MLGPIQWLSEKYVLVRQYWIWIIHITEFGVEGRGARWEWHLSRQGIGFLLPLVWLYLRGHSLVGFCVLHRNWWCKHSRSFLCYSFIMWVGHKIWENFSLVFDIIGHLADSKVWIFWEGHLALTLISILISVKMGNRCSHNGYKVRLSSYNLKLHKWKLCSMYCIYFIWFIV